MPSATSPSFTSAKPSTASANISSETTSSWRPSFTGLSRKCFRLCRIAVDGGHVSQERVEPALLGARVETFEDAARALEPAVGDRALAAEDQVVVGDPECEHRRALHVSLPTAEPVRALARVDACGHVLDPPCSPAQPL